MPLSHLRIPRRLWGLVDQDLRFPSDTQPGVCSTRYEVGLRKDAVPSRYWSSYREPVSPVQVPAAVHVDLHTFESISHLAVISVSCYEVPCDARSC